jgi:hypothetical protein
MQKRQGRMQLHGTGWAVNQLQENMQRAGDSLPASGSKTQRLASTSPDERQVALGGLMR